MRAFCHCTICQKANNAEFADIALFKAKDIVAPDEAGLSFGAEKFPPVLQRGKCRSCHAIAIEYLAMFPLPKLVIVPSKNIVDPNILPEPALHVFYDTRVHDVNDDLPKYSGYLSSQFAFAKRLIGSLLAKR